MWNLKLANTPVIPSVYAPIRELKTLFFLIYFELLWKWLELYKIKNQTKPNPNLLLFRNVSVYEGNYNGIYNYINLVALFYFLL